MIKIESKTKLFGFHLEDEINELIEDFKWTWRKSRSEVVNSVFNFLKKNPEIVEKIKEVEIN